MFRVRLGLAEGLDSPSLSGNSIAASTARGRVPRGRCEHSCACFFTHQQTFTKCLSCARHWAELPCDTESQALAKGGIPWELTGMPEEAQGKQESPGQPSPASKGVVHTCSIPSSRSRSKSRDIFLRV